MHCSKRAGMVGGICEQVSCMNKKGDEQQLTKKQRDVLDDIIKRKGNDEMGLLDLVLIEEILDQIEQDK
mgnify:CR=1 FL=1